MRRVLRFAPALLAACAGEIEGGAEDVSGALDTTARLRVTPSIVQAEQRLGHEDGPPLRFELTIPSLLRGGGLPESRYGGATPLADRSVIQIELPNRLVQAEEASIGVGLFSGPRMCWAGSFCPEADDDGFWQAAQMRGGVLVRPLQVAIALRYDNVIDVVPHPMILGAYLEPNEYLWPGDKVVFEYHGPVPGRSTAWTSRPFRPNVRYRTIFAGTVPLAWHILEDAQVDGLTIAPQPPAFLRVHAPLDAARGESVPVAVVVTDRLGNPSPVTGTVRLSGGASATLAFAGDWRRETSLVFGAAGDVRLAPELVGQALRAVPQWIRVHAEPPPVRRLLGDVHIHTGDGGAQRKFIRSFLPGDHAALKSSAEDAYRYLELVAGDDFGAVSEHAVRDDLYQLPPAVENDAEFKAGGDCAGAVQKVQGIDNWWSLGQAIGRASDGGATGRFVTFPAFEWHSQHTRAGDGSPLHRVVLYRDFDPADALPILPGDVNNIPPQCLVRFFDLLELTPEEVLVIPHMMKAADGNIDWQLTYAEGADLASRDQVEDYTRVGEIFSARSYDQGAGVDLLTGMEGADQDPGPWSYRHGWQTHGAHLGVIGSSDNHSQLPGANDDRTLAGAHYHHNEPAGTAAVLAARRDRDAIYEAFLDRRTYATSGVRAWLDFQVGGAPMGSRVARADATLGARVEILAPMPIARVQIWASRAGATGQPWTLAHEAAPRTETYAAAVELANPVSPGAPAAEWLYYARVFLDAPGTDATHAEEALWSSPVWITWSR